MDGTKLMVSYYRRNSPNYFPSDVLKWMKANAAPRMSFKLMQICKYFRHKKFPYFVVKYACAYEEDAIILNVGKEENEFKNLKNLPNNLWLTGSLIIYYRHSTLRQILKNSVVCDIRKADFLLQEMTFDEFKLLTSGGNLKDVSLGNTKISFKNGDLVPLEDILHHLPNAIHVWIGDDVPNYHYVKNIKYPKLQYLSLRYIKENFNIKDFTKFIIKNQRISYTLHISVRQEYAAKVKKYNEHIVKAWKGRRSAPQFLMS